MNATHHLGFAPVELIKRAKKNGIARVIHRPLSGPEIIKVKMANRKKPASGNDNQIQTIHRPPGAP